MYQVFFVVASFDISSLRYISWSHKYDRSLSIISLDGMSSAVSTPSALPRRDTSTGLHTKHSSLCTVPYDNKNSA